MAPRTRPEGCCARPARCAALPAKPRAALVAVFKALADPTRLEMFRMIAAQPSPICGCDIVARFHLRQPTISHHLRVLREAGLVDAERRGVWSWFSVRPAGVELLRTAADSLAPAEGAPVP